MNKAKLWSCYHETDTMVGALHVLSHIILLATIRYFTEDVSGTQRGQNSLRLVEPGSKIRQPDSRAQAS